MLFTATRLVDHGVICATYIYKYPSSADYRMYREIDRESIGRQVFLHLHLPIAIYRLNYGHRSPGLLIEKVFTYHEIEAIEIEDGRR